MKKFFILIMVLVFSLAFAQRETVVLQPQSIVVKAKHAPAVAVILGSPFRVSYYTGSPFIAGDDLRLSLASNGIATYLSADIIFDVSLFELEENLSTYIAGGPAVGFARYSNGRASATGFAFAFNAVAGLDYRIDSDFSIALEAGPSLGYSSVSTSSGSVSASSMFVGFTGGVALKYYF